MADLPQIAIAGAGIFARTEYIPRLAEISHLFALRAIWSRTQESAKGAVDIDIATKFFPNVECKWGDDGLDDIVQDSSITAVLVVLAAQFQVDLSLKLLKAGKHVLQEKPAASSISEVESALSCYNSLKPSQPIWGVAENYRFEPGFVEGRKLMADIGEMLNFQIIVEVPMNSSSPYFSTSWRHDIYVRWLYFGHGGTFRCSIEDGWEVSSVSAMTSHVDTSLPPPDSISSVIQLDNGCSGVLVTVVSAKTLKLFWRIVGLKGTLQIDVESRDGKIGYLVTLFMADGQTKSSFFPSSGVTEELKAFLSDVTKASLLKKEDMFQAEQRLSFLEGARDFAVMDAMLESGKRQGALLQVTKI